MWYRASYNRPIPTTILINSLGEKLEGGRRGEGNGGGKEGRGREQRGKSREEGKEKVFFKSENINYHCWSETNCRNVNRYKSCLLVRCNSIYSLTLSSSTFHLPFLIMGSANAFHLALH